MADWKYFKDVIAPKRLQEITDGKNLGTRNPIYVVYSLVERYVSGWDEFMNDTNLKGEEAKHGYLRDTYEIDEDGDEYVSEERAFHEDDGDDPEAEMVTQFWMDRLEAIFLTSEAAHEYLVSQSHNLSDPYVYVHYAGYANYQMDTLFNEKAEKND